MEDTRLLALGAMASDLGVSTRSLRVEALAGRIPCVRVGGESLLFDPEAVRRALLERSKGFHEACSDAAKEAQHAP